MLAHVSDNPLHDLEQGMITLNSVEEMIANGTVDIKLRPWTVRARKQLEKAQQMFSETATEKKQEDHSDGRRGYQLCDRRCITKSGFENTSLPFRI